MKQLKFAQMYPGESCNRSVAPEGMPIISNNAGYQVARTVMESLRHARLASATLALAFLSATSALLPAQSVRAESVNTIEEVIVTARKREESLQETPVVVNVLTEDMISAGRIEGIKLLYRTVYRGGLCSQRRSCQR